MEIFEQTKAEREAAYKAALPDLFSAAEIETSLHQNGFYTLPSGTRTLLRIGVEGETAFHYVVAGATVLDTDTEGFVISSGAPEPYPGLPASSSRVLFKLSSPSHRTAMKQIQVSFRAYVDLINNLDKTREPTEEENTKLMEASYKTHIDRIAAYEADAQLAAAFLQNRHETLCKWGIIPAAVTEVQLGIATDRVVKLKP